MANANEVSAPEAEVNGVGRHTAKEQFDRQAAHYDSQWAHWNRESVEWMLEQASVIPYKSVLDVACGTGYTALAFAPHAERVVGLDVSTGMLAVARERAAEQGFANTEFVEGPAESIPFPDASFCLITCRVAAHHFLDVEAFVRESARVLKPGGLFLLADTTVPDDDPEAGRWQNEIELWRDPSHQRNLSPQEWRAVVEASGLKVTAVSSVGGGIELPLTDWLRKAGTPPERAQKVHELLRTAPTGAVGAFQIHYDPAGESHFTWPRVVLAARKPRS